MSVDRADMRPPLTCQHKHVNVNTRKMYMYMYMYMTWILHVICIHILDV